MKSIVSVLALEAQCLVDERARERRGTLPQDGATLIWLSREAEVDSGVEATIMQSIFRVATRRRKILMDASKVKRRVGALKMGWTEPLHDARPMCIEWFAEG